MIKESSDQKVNDPVVPDVEMPPHVRSKRSKVLWLFTFGLLAIALMWFCLWFFYFRFYEYTDDAYANGNMLNITPAIPGSVVAFFADNTDKVVEGQLLVLLDRTKYQVEYEKALANLAATVLQVRQLYDNVHSARAEVENRRVAFNKAQYNFDNRANLVDSLAVSNEEYIHAKDDLEISGLSLKQAEAQLAVAIDAAGNTPIEKHPNIEVQKGMVREAYYNLQHVAIYAPTTGYVAQRAVEVGQSVGPSTALMAIIPTDYVWVDANFKETQLTHMRVGQPAKVTFDIYGSEVVYKGKVLGIASGSGSVFSLIPPQNATGNWIKIVQRLPVRISLDPETVAKFPTRLGISAEVTVDITNRDLPMLVQETVKKPVAVTQVFNLNFDKVNQIIDDIVSANLKNE